MKETWKPTGGTLQLGGSWTNTKSGIIRTSGSSLFFQGDVLSFDPTADTVPEETLGSMTATSQPTGESVYLGGWVTYASTNLGGPNLAADDLYFAGTIDNTNETLEFNSPGGFDGNWVAIDGGTVFQGNVDIVSVHTVVVGSAGGTLENLDSFPLGRTLSSPAPMAETAPFSTFDNASGPLTVTGSGAIEFGLDGGESYTGNEIIVTGSPLTFLVPSRWLPGTGF